jgi:hypothetical protein
MAEEKENEVDVKDLRARPRFVFKLPLDATYNGFPVRIMNVSSSGMQIEHADPLKLQASAKLVISLPKSVDTISLRGAIVWSKLSRTPNKEGKYLYRSGVKLDGQGPAIAASVERVITIYGGEEDKESLERKKEIVKEKAAKESLRSQSASLDSTWRRMPSSQRIIDPDKVLLIEQTLSRLRKDPVEISRLAARARKALEDKVEGREGSDEALAVWEYLERLVPVGMVMEVVDKK